MDKPGKVFSAIVSLGRFVISARAQLLQLHLRLGFIVSARASCCCKQGGKEICQLCHASNFVIIYEAIINKILRSPLGAG